MKGTVIAIIAGVCLLFAVDSASGDHIANAPGHAAAGAAVVDRATA